MSEVVFVLGVLGPFTMVIIAVLLLVGFRNLAQVLGARTPAMAEAAAGGAPIGAIKTVAPQDGPATKLWIWLTETQVWNSIFRHGVPHDRNRVMVMMSNVFLHLHPVRGPQERHPLRFTWCMGGLTFFLFLADVHRRAADVLLPARPSNTPTPTSRPARARDARRSARDAPLGRPRDDHRRSGCT